MGRLIAIGFWILAFRLIRRDTSRRDGISPALWIPTLWAGILLSRPLSAWVGFGGGGGGSDSLEGSPLDSLFYLVMIVLSLVTVTQRNLNWPAFVTRNWPVFLFYFFFLISVLWSDSPVSSFKRWFKDLGNIFVALVILTERNPLEAVRAVFVRCAIVLLPLSEIFLRWFPDLGRYYSRAGGLQVVGVTMQKNSLGVLVLVCGLVLIWDWLERSGRDQARYSTLERWLPLGFFAIGAHLMNLCDSQTSILCLILGAGILASVRLPLLRQRVGALGGMALAAAVGFFLLDSIFGIQAAVLDAMGRDATFTGRTDVWRELLALGTDPLIGTGFCSLWSNPDYLSRLPEWVAFSAHNGYLEIYLDGGWIGIGFLVLMLVVVAFRMNAHLGKLGNYALLRFAVLVSILVGSFSESHFARMGPLWFFFLLVAIEPSSLPRPLVEATPGGAGDSNEGPDDIVSVAPPLVVMA